VADLLSIISSSYVTAGQTIPSNSKYVAVDPQAYEGTWTGKYADNSSFKFQISNVDGFRAKVKYQSGATVQYQDVLIRDNAFRIGNSKFTLTRNGVAQIKTVVTDAATGTNVLNTAYAQQS
jgi:hypothetical protein